MAGGQGQAAGNDRGVAQPVNIWFPNPLGPEVLVHLRTLLPGHEIFQEHRPDAEVLIEGRPEREQLASSPSLKSIIVPFAGVSPGLLALMRGFPNISLHNLHHNAPDTAETALALLLACAKRTVEMDVLMRRNDWSPRYEPEKSELLAGKTAVILGFGEVGRRLAGILLAMGMQVIGIRSRPAPEPDAEVVASGQLHAVLPRAEVLIITIPLTAETQGMIGVAEFDLMPLGAILVNVARAQIVDEQALYDALKSGKLHSAGSDVWYRYPAEEGTAVPTYFTAPSSAKNTSPTNLPFNELPNMTFSPHRGGATRTTEQRRVEHLAAMLSEAAGGKPLPNQVDLGKGY